jgi:hypothetical protein
VNLGAFTALRRIKLANHSPYHNPNIDPKEDLRRALGLLAQLSSNNVHTIDLVLRFQAAKMAEHGGPTREFDASLAKLATLPSLRHVRVFPSVYNDGWWSRVDFETSSFKAFFPHLDERGILLLCEWEAWRW